MTDVELLPLPWTLCHFHDETQKLTRNYARANMEPLRAEIEALRAEVDVLKSENARIREALQAIVDEVSDGLVPYSSDSYLPAHLVEQARAALEQEARNG